MFHESLTATADMTVLPGVIECRALRRTFQVRLGSNTLRLPGGTAIFTVSRQQFMKHQGLANPMWGSPRIVGEISKPGIEVAKSTVEKYRVPQQKLPPSHGWKTFLRNHVKDLVSLDFFVVSTVTHKVLFILLLLAHDRRRVVHFNVTEYPTAQ